MPQTEEKAGSFKFCADFLRATGNLLDKYVNGSDTSYDILWFREPRAKLSSN